MLNVAAGLAAMLQLQWLACGFPPDMWGLDQVFLSSPAAETSAHQCLPSCHPLRQAKFRPSDGSASLVGTRLYLRRDFTHCTGAISGASADV